MTLGQFERAVAGYKKRLRAQAEQTDALNHMLGAYIGVAFHDFKHYPKEPTLLADKKKMTHTPESFRELAKKRWGKK